MIYAMRMGQKSNSLHISISYILSRFIFRLSTSKKGCSEVRKIQSADSVVSQILFSHHSPRDHTLRRTGSQHCGDPSLPSVPLHQTLLCSEDSDIPSARITYIHSNTKTDPVQPRCPTPTETPFPLSPHHDAGTVRRG